MNKDYFEQKAKMRILLIDPGSPRNELDEPLGIETLAGAMQSKFGADVDINFASIQIESDIFLKAAFLNAYNLIGISAKLGSMERISQIVNSIKCSGDDKLPIIILGDLLATFAYEQLLTYYPEAICIRGEGEDALCNILALYLNSVPKSIYGFKEELLSRNISNLAFRYNDQTIVTSMVQLDLSKSVLPDRRFTKDIVRRHGVVLLEASRGCPWGSCSFCAISAKYGNPGWRPFPTDRIISDLEELSYAGVRNPYFVSFRQGCVTRFEAI